MLVISNTNYHTYRNVLNNTEVESIKCLKCRRELPEYNKVTVLKQSETTIVNKHRLCENCNAQNKFHSPLSGRYGI